MSNPSKAKGTRAETKVSKYFTANGLPSERKALAGSEDQGDLRMTLPSGTEVTVEVKAGKQTRNYPRSKLEGWQYETLVESSNSKCNAILVIVQYGRRFVDSEVWIPNLQWTHADDIRQGWTMMYIDDFVRRMGG